MASKAPRETRILVVDDEPDFREALAFSLERKGYQVLLASNGVEAFEIIRSQAIDAVVSDILMPDGDGVELLEKTRAQLPKVPVILLVTGFADITTETARAKGAEALFSKPFDPRRLEEAIQRALDPQRPAKTMTAAPIQEEPEVQLRFTGMKEPVPARALDLDGAGMFVGLDASRYPNVSDAVSFEMQWGPAGSRVKGMGEVRWIRVKDDPNLPLGCGIEFTHLGEADRKALQKFIAP